MSKIKKIVLAAFLLALSIVLSRFLSIKTQVFVISFSFIPLMMAAIWLGPKYTVLIAVLGDIIGAILFPFGAFFPGYTLSAMIRGFIYGFILYNKNKPYKNWNLVLRLILSSVLSLGLVSILINSFWIKIQYNKAYLALLSTRVVSQGCMLPIQVVTIYFLYKATRPFVKKYLLDE